MTSRSEPRAARRPRSRSIASEPRKRAAGGERVPASAAERAHLVACRLLARAPRTVVELEQQLAARGFAADTVAATLLGLRDLRYIDDVALARRRAEELLLRRHCGRLRVVHELTRRGLADSVIAAAVAAVLDDRTEADLVRQALRQRFRAQPVTAAERARAFRFLVARGHPAEIVSDILQEDA